MRSTPRFRALPLVFLFLLATAFSSFAQVIEDDQITDVPTDSTVKHTRLAPGGAGNGMAHARHGIPDIDSLLNWNDQFFTTGIDPNGNTNNRWFYNMVGNPPEHKGTTFINAPIVPVSLDLRNADGSPRFVNGHRLFYDVTPFVQPTFDGPVFQNSTYSSSDVPTQFTDAVQRAQFFNRAKSDWHTILVPSVKTSRTMVLIKGTYRFALNSNGTCCRFVLVDIGTFVNELFPAAGPVDASTPIGAAELAGDITTKDMSTFLFPNTFLTGSFGCCVLGFHSYDSEPGDASNGNREKRYVLNYSSWISHGLFGPNFQDVTANSHEIAESFDDPFVASDGVHNITPFWLSPNGNCQDNLENGDVIEGLPNSSYPVILTTGGQSFTYHPQVEPMLQWFEFESPSSALGGSYSYPNTTTLTNLSPVQKFGCQ